MKPITPIEIIRRRFASADYPEAAPDPVPEPCAEAAPEPEKPVSPEYIAALIAQRGRAVASPGWALRPGVRCAQAAAPPCRSKYPLAP